jgi:N-methylhydantoinase A
MRYQGQGWEIVVILPNRDFVQADESEIRRLFESEYIRLFGRALEGLDIEIMNWSVQVRSVLAETARIEPVATITPTERTEFRSVFDAREQQFVEAAVYQRDQLEVGALVSGPAVIIESETSTIVTRRFAAIKQNDGCLLLRRQQDEVKHG